MPYAWFPDPCGGTEVYVRALAVALEDLGWQSEVAVASPKVARLTTDAAASLPAHWVPAAAQMRQAELYGAGEPSSAALFSQLLAENRPDVVHFHAFSPSVSTLWLDAARAVGIPCVYTYHTPTLACGRGTLLRWGAVPCDGRMTPLRCAACTLHGMGVAKAGAWGLALASPMAGLFLSRAPFRIWPLTRLRIRAVRRWLGGMGRIVALSAWSRAVMERNGVPATRLRLVRHGLAGGGVSMPGRQAESPGPRQGRLRLGFFGRVDRAKGLALLAEVLRQRRDLDLELHCHLIGETDAGPELRALVHQMRGDARVYIHPPAAPEAVVGLMAGYDAVLVPSQGFETGPLVVLEAFAAGVPVIGSDLGGIAEWVTQDLNGMLCPPADVRAWGLALERFTTDAALRARLREGVKPPPAMTEVACRMAEIYTEAMTEAAA